MVAHRAAASSRSACSKPATTSCRPGESESGTEPRARRVRGSGRRCTKGRRRPPGRPRIVRHAGAPDALRADEHLEEVVEARGRLVDDAGSTHDELGVAQVEPEQVEMAVVFDPGVVEIGQIPAVVDDSLRIGVREPDPSKRGELERRLAVGRAAEVHGAAILAGCPV